MALALAAVFAPLVAAAQEAPRTERLYVGQGVLLGSSRVLSLGGAYTAIAEGPAAFSSNLAALAHRAPHLDRRWDLGVAFSWLDLPLTSPSPRDLDNDGRRDNAQRSLQFLVGLMLQYGQVGVGTYLRSTRLSFCEAPGACLPERYLHLNFQHAALGAAVAFGRDELIVGAGLYAADVVFEHLGQQWQYVGSGVELDALYRPPGRPFRLGLSFKPRLVGAYQQKEGQLPSVAGRALYSAVVSPAVVSVGGALRLGEGAEHFNRLSPAARAQLSEGLGVDARPPAANDDAPAGRWLLSLQADVVVGTSGAVSASDLPVGGATYVVPRLGVEHETLPGRLRSRMGTFLETSPFEGVGPRPHLTGGAELYLFSYYEDWAAGFSFDVASQYRNVGLTFGVWR